MKKVLKMLWDKLVATQPAFASPSHGGRGNTMNLKNENKKRELKDKFYDLMTRSAAAEWTCPCGLCPMLHEAAQAVVTHTIEKASVEFAFGELSEDQWIEIVEKTMPSLEFLVLKAEKRSTQDTFSHTQRGASA